MLSSFFSYDKPKVLQALRYHFISRREIMVMIILVNVFAIMSAALYFLHKVTPVAFILASGLWFILMISFWFALPFIIYRKSSTFQNSFRVDFADQEMSIETERGSRSWPWSAFSFFKETPYFFHLYFDARTFFLIPKDSFADVPGARDILKRKISN